MFLIDWFTIYIYQPFFNLLVGIYWLLEQIPNIPHADMGVAVVIFTLALRMLLLPISLASDRSENERRQIEESAVKLKQKYKNNPVKYSSELKRLFRGNRRIVVAEGINLFIQISIALMLWRIFASGLAGADIHLLYTFMPQIDQPFNLIFLGRYDLSQPSFMFSLIVGISLFLVEVIKIFNSPFPVSRKEVVRLQFVLPVISFIIFLRLPAGKTLFVITTLAFSLVIITIMAIRQWFKSGSVKSSASTVAESKPEPNK